jgi:hypothetical protein
MDMSRVDGVKAPPHDGTPRSHQVHHLLVLLRFVEGSSIEHFDGVTSSRLLQSGSRSTSLVEGRIQNKRRRLVGVVFHRVVRRARYEAKGALAADHELLDHLDRFVWGDID